MRFRTLNSMYEVDLDGRRLRRIASTHAPTPRQAPDGEWKEFVSVTDISVDGSVFVDWDGEGHGTWLTTVMEVTER